MIVYSPDGNKLKIHRDQLRDALNSGCTEENPNTQEKKPEDVDPPADVKKPAAKK